MQKRIQLLVLSLTLSMAAFGQAEKPVAEVEPRFFDANCEKIQDPETCRQCANMQMLKKLFSSIRYPEEARQNNISGEVVAKFVIKEDGSVGAVEITQNLGYGCDEATVEAVRSLGKFLPGLQDGKPVETTITLPVRFRSSSSPQSVPGNGKRDKS